MVMIEAALASSLVVTLFFLPVVGDQASVFLQPCLSVASLDCFLSCCFTSSAASGHTMLKIPVVIQALTSVGS